MGIMLACGLRVFVESPLNISAGILLPIIMFLDNLCISHQRCALFHCFSHPATAYLRERMLIDGVSKRSFIGKPVASARY